MQIYARRHFLFPPLSIEEYNDRVRAVVRCEAQVCFFLFLSSSLLVYVRYIVLTCSLLQYLSYTFDIGLQVL